jgi:hypothetical protein
MDGYRLEDVEKMLRGREVRYVTDAVYGNALADPLGLKGVPEGMSIDAVRFILAGGYVLVARSGHVLLTRAEPTALPSPMQPDGIVDEPVRDEDCNACDGTGKVDSRQRVSTAEWEPLTVSIVSGMLDSIPQRVAEDRLSSIERYELSRLHAMLGKELGLCPPTNE